ncbi:glutathione S-transferase C-terminal domain-containing protein [Cereibacter sp. SYSU M97828]|nr:glutathione S-transferase C-terminal domain-containing protein [Cereibacter flavus]
MLVDGKWSANWTPVSKTDEKGGFIRPTSSFRNFVGRDGFDAEPGRYHLYVALICPWASRTLIARKLKGLEEAVSVSVVSPVMTDQGWTFGGYPDATEDEVNGFSAMHEVYTAADPQFTGRATVPVLWDKKRGTIVNNESADILRMMNDFGGLSSGPDLYPEPLRDEIDAMSESFYDALNNGVYRAGFAQSQEAYEEAVSDVFMTLDRLEEEILGPFIFGEALTESDIRLFVTLVRFDAAYHGLFKTNLKRLADYPRLTAFLKAMLAVPGVRDTVSIDHIKRGYYSLKALNPNGIVPAGPDLDWWHR